MLVDLTVSYDYGLNSLASVLVGPPWLPTVPLHLELPFNMVLERIFFFFIHTQAGALSNISHFFVLILVPKDLCFIFYQLSFTNMLYQVFLRHICPPLLHFKLSMFFFFFRFLNHLNSTLSSNPALLSLLLTIYIQHT